MGKIGVFGGTFNPIHNGHLNLISSFQKEFEFDEILLIPTNVPPHKQANNIVEKEHRIEMCRLAIEDISNASVNEIEFERAEKSYTYVTLSQLKQEYNDAKFYLIMGSDMFLSLKTWYKYDELKKIAVFCTACREKNEFKEVSKFSEELKSEGAQCYVLNIDAVEISSTQVREKIMFDEDCSSLVPEKVIDYIKKSNLYSIEKTIPFYKDILKKKLDQKRYIHSLNVAESALELATKYGANKNKAFLAGLLHDITKQEDEKIQLQIMESSAIICDEVERNNKHLWHAITGAWYVKNILGIHDNEIIDAVRWHTEFRENATLLDKIIYLADFISLDREYADVDVMREKCNSSLEEGLLYGLSYTLKENSKNKMPIAIESVKAYNSLLIHKNIRR